MTSQDHNKMIGIMHLIYGGFNALMLLIMIPFMLFIFGTISRDPQTPPEMRTFFSFFGVFFVFLALLLGVPSLVAAYGMLKKKSWARMAGIIASIVAAMSFPFGTALCVYSLWFLFGEGKTFHERQDFGTSWQGSLKSADSFDWDANRAKDTRRTEYVPPVQPPDWRA